MQLALSDCIARARHTFAQSSRRRDLVVLFVDQDSADLFAHGIFSRVFALSDAHAIVANRLRFIIEIELQYLHCLIRGSDSLGYDRRNTAR